jgi:ProP effector
MNVKLTPENLPDTEKLLTVFLERFPNAFQRDPLLMRPLKINIHFDLRTALGGQYSNKAISRALQLYVRNPNYRDTLKEGAVRVDLEGNPCGEVTVEHLEIGEEVKARRRKQVEKKLNPPPVEELPKSDDPPIEGKLTMTVKLTKLPEKVKETKNGWKTFLIEADAKQFTQVKVTIRPRTWNKLLQAPYKFPYWTISITGKKGSKIRFGGFELSEPVIQIHKRNPEVDEPSVEFPPPPREEGKPALVQHRSVPSRRRISVGDDRPPRSSIQRPYHTDRREIKPAIIQQRPTIGLRKNVETPALQRPTISHKESDENTSGSIRSTLGLKKTTTVAPNPEPLPEPPNRPVLGLKKAEKEATSNNKPKTTLGLKKK